MLSFKKLKFINKASKIFFLASFFYCFLFRPLPLLAIEDFQMSQSHSFVANVARKVSPSVVRIDIERDIETDDFDSDLLDPLLRDLLGDLGSFPKTEMFRKPSVLQA